MGVRGGIVHGRTSADGVEVVEKPVGVPDLFATICAAMGVNPSKSLMDGERPVPLTDKGTAVAKLFVAYRSTNLAEAASLLRDRSP